MSTTYKKVHTLNEFHTHQSARKLQTQEKRRYKGGWSSVKHNFRVWLDGTSPTFISQTLWDGTPQVRNDVSFNITEPWKYFSATLQTYV